ncbi:hypothetical protein [Terrabacter terrigena]|uniref:Uncharacterized protein n=1 Tax=Terrabacter terrigena TaxID=574718 RepID=A0ABW3MY40_9MICO
MTPVRAFSCHACRVPPSPPRWRAAAFDRLPTGTYVEMESFEGTVRLPIDGTHRTDFEHDLG